MNNKYILGCDPGISGAIVLYNCNNIIIYDTPTHEITINNKKKKRIDLYELSRIIDLHSAVIELAIIEEVYTSPQMGVTSAGAFMESFGILKGVIAANFIPIEMVRPQVWKKHFGLTSDKDASRRKASSMFPKYADKWCRSKDDGRAEALLIAVWGSK